ncbi:psychosine receptor [Ursus americanus]|uniref:G-protein coupled receptor 65 n=2 Tax=Ursus TaxID=9639 RepID=A0A384CRT1_URSMA|nr:psychosine receptor isoform X1 [Ursus maritimus]XP_026371284.1 psychosine receptor [Ursus arctos]XP_040497511.1 psychosine receptor isoform X1 [Ursus maritimus]XP_040497512.1 psychosine receptor isoform X1 [Ursus maritimus]XP_040497513.1 psychosine receptor isoform X1 [Ursus maritimus]XP_040497514.1 psychosine receptor isoform X1 [Ursus maritimus]XP_040497515.1 psychosine receptor isoform X1 [Ursus maritimus]XP_045663653.1 psychosine receptor [Ursus americanus]XP_045663654.1 psychosine r
MNSTCIAEQHDLDHYLFPVVYIFVVIASVPANIGSLCVSFLQAKKENELGIYLFSLSLSDLLYTLTLPLWIDYTWNNDNWTFSPALCKGSAFFMYMNFYSSTAFLTCIAVDRYLAVVHPLKFSFLRTRRFAFMVSLSIWVLETMFNGVILWEDETTIEYCDPQKSNFTLCYDKYPLEKWQIRFNFFRTCTGYAIPLVIIMICNQKVYQAVQHNQATENSEKKRIIKLLASITLTFVLCFTPFHVMLLIRSILEHDVNFSEPLFNHHRSARQTYKMYRITVALTSLNCVADPILYCFVTETGRSDMWNILKFCMGKLNNSKGQRKSILSMSTRDTVELEILE